MTLEDFALGEYQKGHKILISGRGLCFETVLGSKVSLPRDMAVIERGEGLTVSVPGAGLSWEVEKREAQYVA